MIIIIILYKNGISKNFLDTISDNKDLPNFVTKKWIEVYDHKDISHKEIMMLINKLELKHQC